MPPVFMALRRLLAALPAVAVLLWLLAPLCSTTPEMQGREREAHVSRGAPREQTPTQLPDVTAPLLETIEEDGEDDGDADERAATAEISTLRAIVALGGPFLTRSPHPASRACCIRGPPSTRA